MSAASTDLPADTTSVPAARRFVCTILESWDLRLAYEAAEMLVSELVTNAVLHARTAFTLQVLVEADTVRVSVMDRSPVLPKQRTYGSDSTTGRGLRLVATLSSDWGVDRTFSGKTVWFEVPATGDSGAEVPAWDLDADLDALLATFDDLDQGDPATQPPKARTELTWDHGLQAAA